MPNHYICSNVRQTSGTKIFFDWVEYEPNFVAEIQDIVGRPRLYLSARVGMRGHLLANQRQWTGNRMKITDIRWTPAFIPIEAPLRYSVGSHPGFSRIVIEVETDEGITGLGECYSGASRAGQLADLKPLLIGEDPMNLERIRWKVAAPSSEKLFGFVLGFAGLEFAILDIQGKALKRPVCDLLGGGIRTDVPFAAYLFYRYANDDGIGDISTTEQMVRS